MLDRGQKPHGMTDGDLERNKPTDDQPAPDDKFDSEVADLLGSLDDGDDNGQ